MTQTSKKCVVLSSCVENVQSSVEQQRAAQAPQNLQSRTWAQYLLANNFSNKSDIIDCNRCGLKALLDELHGANICTSPNTLLSLLQIIASSLYLSLTHLPNNKGKGFLNLTFHGEDSNSKEKPVTYYRGTESKFSKNRKEPINVRAGCEIGYYEQEISSNFECRSNISKHQPRPHLFIQLIALSALILSIQNALPCSGFMYPLRYDNTGFIGYNYPNESPTLSNLNAAHWNNPNRNPQHRNNDDPMLLMSTSRDSFTNDQSSQPQTSVAPTLKSWTSMLTNAFGNPQKDVLDNHIRKILVPRVSGTEGIVKVREYITSVLKANNYYIELDEFTDNTPVGKVKFSNIIASSNPNACRQLVLACHYDSKMMDGFLGAVDSAVPCAMLLKISETFNKAFRPEATSSGDSKDNLGLRFIFFDGEEAFEQWSATDSLYGSRHLAEKWFKQPAPSQCLVKNELERIELFVLLDLIGSSDTSFVMYNVPLKHHYNAMQKYEKQYLANSGLSASQARRETAFKGRYLPLDFVEDDHVPFKKRGVPILSLLANPFPKVWHTVDDNYDAIDFSRTRRILYVLEQFVANYKKEVE